MATYDLPSALKLAVGGFSIVKSGVQFRSPFNGTTQAVNFVAERWAMSLTSTPRRTRNAGAVEAFLNRLAGGVHKVRMHHPTRLRPTGSLRGVPTLYASTASGDVSIKLTNCTNKNLLINPGFESVLSIAPWAQTGASFAASIDISGNCYAGLRSLRIVNATAGDSNVVAQSLVCKPNTTYTFSAYVYVAGALTAGAQANRSISMSDGSGFANDTSLGAGHQTGAWVRKSVSLTTSPTATYLALSLWAPQGTVYWDAAQLEEGPIASEIAAPPDLMAGDMLGVADHLFQVAEDCQVNTSGVMTVPLVNRPRRALAAGSAAVWDRPTTTFVMPAQTNGSVYRPGYVEGAVFDLEESWI